MPAQVAWTRRNVVVYPATCSLAGLVAGMFGVGGGIVKVPTVADLQGESHAPEVFSSVWRHCSCAAEPTACQSGTGTCGAAHTGHATALRGSLILFPRQCHVAVRLGA